MEQQTLKSLFILQLKDIYSAEKQLAEALPRMAKIASNKELKMALREHLELSKIHYLRIDEIYKSLSHFPTGENCNTMEALIEEMEEMVEENDNTEIINISLICAFQKIEHYEIASYGSVITFAKALGLEYAADVLQQSLDEEFEMDNKLDKLAEEVVSVYSKINS
ncbi:MAG: DUF892 family protein [Cytophagaceae bacterium]|nr:DUF892 family protein [Cytophagaceae bacterium]